MPLIDLLKDLASDLGVDINSATEKEWLIGKVNCATRDLYNQNDLLGCLREQLFLLGSTDQQISLPYYVFEIRAVRNYDTRYPVKLLDMSPRYQTEGWADSQDFYLWRIKRQASPVKAAWFSDGPLKFTLSAPASKDFTINIIGQTNQATKTQETLSVLVGQTEVTSANNYLASVGVEAITKSDVTDEDILVTSLDGIEISDIPNSEKFPSFTIVQVQDKWQSKAQTDMVEVLYKTRFTPFVNDYDVFPCGDIYEEAIYWNTLGHVWAKNEGEQWVTKVIAANAKAQEQIEKIASNREAGRQARMSFGTSRWMYHPRLARPNRWHEYRKYF